ncbi:MAG: hypothetical protein QN178_04545 [Armatimonadota bacterium]|nr:hypothetical protein [Armatimonadota bacterium]
MKTRRVTLVLTLIVIAAVPAGLRAGPTPAVGECRPQSVGERPNLTADDVVNCVVGAASATRLRVSAAYTYASPLGRQNIWMGLDVLAGGNRLKWFGYRPVAITGSNGTAEFEIVYGLNSPPKGKLTTDQIEFFMYVGGGQIFYRRLFNLKHEWQL